MQRSAVLPREGGGGQDVLLIFPHSSGDSKEEAERIDWLCTRVEEGPEGGGGGRGGHRVSRYIASVRSIARAFDRERRYSFGGRSTDRLPRREAEIETRRRRMAKERQRKPSFSR